MGMFPWSEDKFDQGRQRLRAEVYSERGSVLYRDEWVPQCVLCGNPLINQWWDDTSRDGYHLHEAIVTRGDLPTSDQYMIFHRCNVVQLCPRCHEREGHSKDKLPLFTSYLVGLYGPAAVAEWLETLPIKAGIRLDILLE